MDGKTGTNGIPAAHIPSPAGRMKAGFEENGLPTEIGGLPLMPDEQSAEKIAELFKLISDGTRLRVLVLHFGKMRQRNRGRLRHVAPRGIAPSPRAEAG